LMYQPEYQLIPSLVEDLEMDTEPD
jgi:hypothetical protein